MTKKDYKRIANVFNISLHIYSIDLEKDSRPDQRAYGIASNAIRSVATAMSYALKEDNPKFDREKFLEAVEAPQKS